MVAAVAHFLGPPCMCVLVACVLGGASNNLKIAFNGYACNFVLAGDTPSSGDIEGSARLWDACDG